MTDYAEAAPYLLDGPAGVDEFATLAQALAAWPTYERGTTLRRGDPDSEGEHMDGLTAAERAIVEVAGRARDRDPR